LRPESSIRVAASHPSSARAITSMFRKMTTASGCAYSSSRYSASSALALFMLPLSQPHARSAAVLVDELDQTARRGADHLA
jgi:hypothetical protein